MRVSLTDLTYLSELDYFKTILSSADVFPGLYRISSSWQQALHDDCYLKLFHFLEIGFKSQKGASWNREKWFQAHEKIFELSYGKHSRNEQRTDGDLKPLLKERGAIWFREPKSFALALIDNVTVVEEILPNKTYYMMGSLIRFEKDRFLISYDDYSGDFYQSLNISFEQAAEYIKSAFSKKSLGQLFLQAQIVAHLNFENDIGQLKFHPEKLDILFSEFPPNCPIFATPNYSQNLPIRLAKLIGVTNVLQ